MLSVRALSCPYLLAGFSFSKIPNFRLIFLSYEKHRQKIIETIEQWSLKKWL